MVDPLYPFTPRSYARTPFIGGDLPHGRDHSGAGATCSRTSRADGVGWMSPSEWYTCGLILYEISPPRQAGGDHQVDRSALDFQERRKPMGEDRLQSAQKSA